MRTPIRHLMTWLLMLGVVCACSKDEKSPDLPPEPDPGPTITNPISFSALLNNSNGFKFAVGDVVGIFAIKSKTQGEIPTLAAEGGYANNIQYKVNALATRSPVHSPCIVYN